MASEEQIIDLALKGELIIHAGSWSRNDDRVKRFKDAGVRVYDTYGEIDLIHLPEEPDINDYVDKPAKADYIMKDEEGKKVFDEEGYEEDMKIYEQEVVEFEETKKQYKLDLEQYKDDTKEAMDCLSLSSQFEIEKGFVKQPSERGKFSPYSEKVGQNEFDPILMGHQEQLAKLKTRINRNKELDREKIYKKVYEELVTGKYYEREGELTDDEWAFLMYMIGQRTGDRTHLKKAGVPSAYSAKANSFRKKFTKELFATLVRTWMIQESFSKGYDHEKQTSATFMFDVTNDWKPEDVKVIVDEQMERRRKRQEREKKKKTDLENLIKERKAEIKKQETAKSEPKEPTKKEPAKKGSGKKTNNKKASSKKSEKPTGSKK